MEKIKPVLCLSIICTLVCALLIVTYNLTYVDTSGVITDDLQEALIKVDGNATFELITDKEGIGITAEQFPDVLKVVRNKESGNYLFEIVTDGYATDGIDCVIGIDENGAVKGIAIVALGETPGLGTKVDDDNFLSKFVGFSSEVVISKNPPKADNEVQGVTGSTFSSKGVAKAVNAAIAANKAIREGE